MKLLTAVFLAGGVALFAWLIARQGLTDVLDAAAAAGWGILAIALFHIVPLTLDAVAWRRLLKHEWRLSLAAAIRIRWLGESVNGLLPAAQIVSELVRVRLAVLSGIPGSVAGAVVTVDLTLGVFSQVIFTLSGLLILYALGIGGSVVLVVGPVAFAVLFVLFLAFQKAGMFGRITKLIGRSNDGSTWLKVIAGADALDAEIKALYRRRGAVFSSLIWKLGSWTIGAGEVWLGLYFLGHPVTVLEAFVLESLTQAVRSAAFIVPGGLGVQEGGFVLIGTTIGIAPETALAMSLLKRVRELAVGIPALILWKMIEGRRLLRRRQA
ncbi:MAG TPA: lysylphosphatidylglycerol synthase domain-containing protein [Alphaproteobacteria bacterium]